MADIIQVACPSCKAVFDIPPEYAGQVGECSECGATFLIPSIEPKQAQPPPPPPPEDIPQDSDIQEEIPENFTNTDTNAIGPENEDGVPEGELHSSTETRTVKLSRSSIGMVPELQDDFKVDVVKNKPMTASTSKSIQPQIPSKSIPNVKSKSPIETEKSQLKSQIASSSSASLKSDFPLKPKKKWWMFWK